MPRLTWLLLLIGLALGLAGGLYYGWVISPVQYVDVNPAALAPVYQDDYLLMIATRYAADANLAAAEASLQALGFTQSGSAMSAATQRLRAAHAPEADVRRMEALTAALTSPP